MLNKIPPKKYGYECKIRSGIFKRLRDMNINDCIVEPSSTYVSAHQYAKQVGIKITLRMIPEKDVVEIYRIK